VAKLTVKNNSGAELTLTTPDGAVKVKAAASEDLTERQLTAPSVVDALGSGKLSIVTPGDEPSWDEIALAQTVLPPIVRGTATKLTQLNARFVKSQSALKELGLAFNRARGAVEANLDAAQAAVKGWPDLEKAVQVFVVATEQESAEEKKAKEELNAAQKQLDDLKDEDLTATQRTLEEWYTDRVAKEVAVQKAREAVDKIVKAGANPLVQEVKTLSVTIANLQAIVRDNAIGKPIPELK